MSKSKFCGVDEANAIEQLQAKVEHIKSLLAEVEQLRAIKFQRFNNEDCWIYQGDGEDHLESLVCPVVVSPQKLIEFAETITQLQGRVAELESQNNNLCLLIVRLARRVRLFEKGSDVATKALDYLSRNGLMPSVLRNKKQ